MSLIRIVCLSLFVVLCNGCGKSETQYQGYVEAENTYIASPYGGRLLHLFVQRGAVVKKGAVLYKLDPNPELSGLAQQKAVSHQAEEVLKDLMSPKRKPEIDTVKAELEENAAQLALASL